MSAAEREMLAVLAEHGFRATRPRRAIVQALCEADAPLTLSALHRAARARYPKTGLATLYRTLEVLERCGLVHRIQLNGESYLMACADQSLHYHLVCVKCHKVVEVHAQQAEELLGALARQHGFTMSAAPIEVRGVCAACRT